MEVKSVKPFYICVMRRYIFRHSLLLTRVRITTVKCKDKLRNILHTFFAQGLADNCVVARVNGELWDLDR
jgi:hypothetical protein